MEKTHHIKHTVLYDIYHKIECLTCNESHVYTESKDQAVKYMLLDANEGFVPTQIIETAKGEKMVYFLCCYEIFLMENN